MYWLLYVPLLYKEKAATHASPLAASSSAARTRCQLSTQRGVSSSYTPGL